MAATTLTELTDLAKDFYSNVYVNLVNPENALKAQFSRLENAMFTGKKWIFGVKSEIGGGAANVIANKSLPAESQGKYDQGDATLVRTYTVMALDGLAIEVTKKQAGSYKPALAEVMQDRLQAHDQDINRQLFGQSHGALAKLATDSGTTQVLELAYGVANGGSGTKFIYPGDVLQPYSATSGGSARTKAGVVSVDHANQSIVVDTDPVTTAGDFFFKATSDTDNRGVEAVGLLQSVAASGDLHNIAVASHPRWSSYVLANSGTLRPVTDSLVMQMISVLRERSRMAPNLIVTTPGIVLKYSEIFLPLRRLDGQDVQLKGGYKPMAAVVHAGGAIPVLADSDCPGSRMFFLNTSAFRMADLVGTEWAELDGAMFDRVSGKDQITGYIRKYWNLITVHRSANGLLADLEDISAISKRF